MKKSVHQGILYMTIASFIFVGVSYIINIWLGRFLEPGIYGNYGIVISLWTVVNLILVSGLPSAVTRYVSSDEKNSEGILKAALYIQLVSAAVVTAAFILLSGPIAGILSDTSLIPYIRISALIIPVYSLYSLCQGYYSGLHRFGKMAAVSIVYSLTKLISVIGLAYLFNLYGAVAGFIAAPTASILIGFHWPKIKALKSKYYKKLILFSLPMVGLAFFSTLLQSVDLYFVKALSKYSPDSGYYTAGQNIARVMMFALSAFSVVLYPSISQSVALKDWERSRGLIRRSLRYVLIILTPTAFLISATSSRLVRFLYGTNYLNAAKPLSILVFAFAFITVFIMLSSILNGAGKPHYAFAVSVLAVLITSVLCLLMIPTSGIRGAASATFAGGLFAVLSAGILVYRKFQVLLPVASLIKILSGSIAVYILAGIIIFPVLLLPFMYLTLLGIYVLILIILKEIKMDDLAQIRKII